MVTIEGHLSHLEDVNDLEVLRERWWLLVDNRGRRGVFNQ